MLSTLSPISSTPNFLKSSYLSVKAKNSVVQTGVKALQFNWDKKLATPANWKPGDAGIAGAPLTLEDSLQRDEIPQVLCCTLCTLSSRVPFIV